MPHPCSSLGILDYFAEVRAKKADRKEEARERDLSLSEKAAAARSRLRKVVAYGNMAVMAGRLASGTRQRLEEAVAEPSKRNSLEQEMAVAAMGAKHTEQQLLRASRLGLVASRAHPQDWISFMCWQN